MAEYEYVTVEHVDDVGRITMERPDASNALNPQFATELRDAVQAAARDDDLRSLVLTGTGGVFNTGADLAVLEGDRSDADTLRALATRLHVAVRTLVTAPKPTITAVNGVAAGGGFGLALAGDVVLLSEAGRLEFAYPRVGLTGDGGSTYFLPRLVGQRRAREIALLDEPIDPERAADLGLVTEVVPDDELADRTAAVAARLADGPTTAYGEIKRLLTHSEDRTLAGQLAGETETITRMVRTRDWQRGHAAFFEDGSPEFVGN